MKRLFLTSAVCFAICMAFCGSLAFGAENTSAADWKGDYSAGGHVRLIVSVESAVNYNQRVTAVMYPADITNPTVYDFCRMAEVEVKGKGKQDIVINIGDDLSYSDEDGNRHYKLSLRGSGTESGNVSKTFDVYFLTPRDIPNVLAAINAANTQAELESATEPVINALKIDKSTLTELRIKCLLDSKVLDFGNGFETLNDFEKCWKISEIIGYLSGSGVDAQQLKALVEKHADVLEIDKTDADYAENTDFIYANLCRVKDTYKRLDTDRAGIRSGKNLKSALRQYQAVAAINNESSLNDDADKTVEKYYEVLDISSEYVNKFKSLSYDNQRKALRAVLEVTYTEPKQISEKYRTVIDELSKPESTDPPSPAPPSGGGSGGGGGAIGITKPPASADSEAQPNVPAHFGDCDSAHWAYSYVSALKEKNVISGYEDGNFYPEKSVTREEFIKLIISAVGLYNADSECEFRDLTREDWCFRYVASAVNEGIISGIDESNFGTGSFISREDVAVIAARILDRFKKSGAAAECDFTDAESISDYAAESVKMLYGMKILAGFDDGSYRPQDNLTRAEAAKIIYMIIKIV